MNNIATFSIDEGLDFGFNLIVGPAAAAGRDDGVLAQRLLNLIENFVSPRYAGEPGIALSALEDLVNSVPITFQRNREQILAQLAWLREQMPEELN